MRRATWPRSARNGPYTCPFGVMRYARVTWQALETEAPEIARLGRERLEAARLALIGTLRADGSPRISPIEPYFAAGALVFGAMAWSRKAHDLQRDPRCVVHSVVTGPNAGEGELKLYGRAEEADADLREACLGAWWTERPETAWVFALRVDEATFVEWDLAQGQMTTRSWSPERGLRQRRRAYP